MTTVWASLANAGGGYGNEVEVAGRTREEILQKAWSRAVGSEYVLVIRTEDKRTELWNEHGDWTDEGKKLLPE